MKLTKRLFDVIFIVISAGILLILSEFELLEKYVGFALIPILIAYFVGKFAERKLGK